MILSNNKYSIEFDQKGSIISLKSNGKEFVCSPLPLFSFKLRKADETIIITSDEAIVSLIENNEEKLVYSFEFNDILFKVTVTFDERISFNFSFNNNTEKYVEWVIFP